MINRRRILSKFMRKQLFSCSPLPVEPQTPSLTHKDLCFSLVDQLLSRGLILSAQKVIERLISKSPSILEAKAAIDFSFSRGMDLSLGCCGFHIRQRVVSGDVSMAEALYRELIVSRGFEPDRNLLNSMLFCYSKLGKLNEAKFCFDKLLNLGSMPGPTSISALVIGLLEQGKPLESYDCFCRISEAFNNTLEFSCYNKLVNGLCSRGFLDEGLHVFNVMVERGISPTVHICKSLIIGFCKRGRVEEAEFLCSKIESYGFVVDEFMYTFLINSYCTARKLNMAMRLFMKMLKLGYEPDGYTYNTLIHGFFNTGLLAKGLALHNQMISSGLKPDVVTYQMMLKIYCKDQKVDHALMLLEDMPHHSIVPNVHCYTVLFAALCKEERWEEVFKLYHKMISSGVAPDHVLFFTLVKNFREGNELNFAYMVLQTIAELCNIDITAISRSSRLQSVEGAMVEIEHLLEEIAKNNYDLFKTAFDIFLIALCRGGNLDAAWERLEKMEELPCVSAMNSFIKLLTQDGRVEDVVTKLEVLQARGLVPNMFTFSIIVNEFCKKDDFPSVVRVLERMEESGNKPNVAIYDSIINCLGRQRRIQEAENYFYRMLKSGIDPDETVFVTMINAYSKNGWARSAYELFEKMIGHNLMPNSHAYTALIPGLVKKNMTQIGCLYLERMLKDGFMPNAVLYTSLIKQFLWKREFEFAFRLVDLMDKGNFEKDLVLYSTLVSGVCRNARCYNGKWFLLNDISDGQKEKLFHLLHQGTVQLGKKTVRTLIRSQEEMKDYALTLIRKARMVFVIPDLYLYNGIISMLCWARRIHEAYEHLSLMERDGLYPNQVTFNILIGAHIQSGEVDLAVALYYRMNADGVAPDGMLFNTLIRGFCKFGRVFDALYMSQIMQKRGFLPSKSSYEKLLSSLCASHSSLLALKICEDMISHNYFPCRFNFQWLISLLCNDGKVDEARALHDSVFYEKTFQRDLRTYPLHLAESHLAESCA